MTRRLGSLSALLCPLALLLCISCSKEPLPPIKIAINPWPGYDFLYLSEQKGFFDEVGLNAKLVQLGSLSDTQRAYMNGSVEGMTSTMIEAVQAYLKDNQQLRVVMVADYSNGGDVIVARNEIQSVKELKGKTVGCEVTSLGIFVLQRALSSYGLSLEDVTIVNVEQLKGEAAMLAGQIDAFVSYPPVSVNILNNEGFHNIFTSAEIPNEIMDVVSVSEAALKLDPTLQQKLIEAWQLGLDYFDSNQADAVAIMAKREGISAEDFLATLSDIKVFNAEEQLAVLSEPQKLESLALEVCKTLVHAGSITNECNDFSKMIYFYDSQ